jgi:malonyl CoA-acyl carrier protein transacylase
MRDAVRERSPELLERCLELVGEDPFARVTESTRFAQPAIFCASLAGLDAYDGPAPRAGAGHSLGELAALVGAGVFTPMGALELVVLRGRLMAEADDRGSMLALVGGSDEDVEAIAGATGLTVANDNSQGQVVLSGLRDDLEEAGRVAKERGVRAIPLDVAGAFHSPLMAPATEPFAEALAAATVNEPRFPVYSCASAAPFTDVRAELAAALTSPVRWRETMLAMHADGAQRFVEVGPGKVLTKLARRIVPDAAVETVKVEAAHA